MKTTNFIDNWGLDIFLLAGIAVILLDHFLK